MAKIEKKISSQFKTFFFEKTNSKFIKTVLLRGRSTLPL